MNRKVYTERSRSGFTLIELLVVIAIIGILSAISLVSFQSVQKQARDAVRRSDLNQYRTALANYVGKTDGFYQRHGTTDASPSAHMNWGVCSYWLMTNPCSGGGASISSCPKDPKNDSTYYYRYLANSTASGNNGCGNTATQYLLYAKLEDSDRWYYICANGKTGRTSSEPVASNCW